MKLEKENKKELFHLYWIIQGIILMFGIKGIGNLPLIGGSYLITITILNVFFNNETSAKPYPILYHSCF